MLFLFDVSVDHSDVTMDELWESGRGLPMAHMLTFNEIVPVRDYMDFGEDIRKRWQQ